MRPTTVAQFVGQAHLFGPNKLLARAIASDRVPSMILWGPPGVGKTTLGRVLAAQTKHRFVPFSAVLGSVAELRIIVGEANEEGIAVRHPLDQRGVVLAGAPDAA